MLHHVPFLYLLTMVCMCRVSSLIVVIPLPGRELPAKDMAMYLAPSSLVIPSLKTSMKTSGEVELGKSPPNSLIMVSNRTSFWPPVARTSELMSMKAAVSSPLSFWKRSKTALSTTSHTLKFSSASTSTSMNSVASAMIVTLIPVNPSRQNPHCEGCNRHRIIFDARVPGGRQVRHSVRIESGKYVIGAGLAHGVSHEAEFTLYSERERSLDVVVVGDAAVIGDFQTVVTTFVHPTKALFAKLTRVGNLSLYLTPGGNSLVLEEIIRQMDVKGTNAANFRLVEEVKEAKLEVAVENDLAVFKVLDERLKRLGLTALSFKTTPDRLTHALGAAAHYYWYLDLTKANNHIDTKDGVTVDFYLLQESKNEYDDYGMPLLVPVDAGFCTSDETSQVIDFVVDPDALYGIKVTNNTTRDLYLNAFLFNNSSLSIGGQNH